MRTGNRVSRKVRDVLLTLDARLKPETPAYCLDLKQRLAIGLGSNQSQKGMARADNLIVLTGWTYVHPYRRAEDFYLRKRRHRAAIPIRRGGTHIELSNGWLKPAPGEAA